MGLHLLFYWIVAFLSLVAGEAGFDGSTYKYAVAILTPVQEEGHMDMRIHCLDDVIITINNGILGKSSKYNLTQERYVITLPTRDHETSGDKKGIMVASPSPLDILVTSCGIHGHCSSYHVPPIHSYSKEFYAVVWSPQDVTDDVNMITVMATEDQTQTHLWKKSSIGYDFEKLITLNALQTHTHTLNGTSSGYKVTSDKPVASYSTLTYNTKCNSEEITSCSLNCTTEQLNCTVDASNCTQNGSSCLVDTFMCSGDETDCAGGDATNCDNCTFVAANCTGDGTNCTLDLTNCNGTSVEGGSNSTAINCTFIKMCTSCEEYCETSEEKNCTHSSHFPLSGKHSLGNEYLVPVGGKEDHNASDDGFHLRIVSISDDNYVTVHYHEQNDTMYMMHEGDLYDFHIERNDTSRNSTDNSTSQWASVNCTETCLVAKVQHLNSTNVTEQHRSISYVPHLHKNVRRFVFSAFDSPHYENFTTKLTVIAHDEDKGDIFMDGEALDDGGAEWEEVGDEHKVIVKDIEPGSHYVTSGRVTKTFQAYVDGFKQNGHQHQSSSYTSSSDQVQSLQKLHKGSPAHFPQKGLNSPALMTQVANVHDCMTSCYDVSECVSVVYDKDTHVCELHDVLHHSAKHYLEDNKRKDVFMFR